MKIITLILSVFILSISAMTCGDTIASASHNESYNHIENQTHNHSQETKDSCTPFCTCQCCGISITSPILYIFDIIKKYSTYSCTFHYTSLYCFNYKNGVWHPPMVG